VRALEWIEDNAAMALLVFASGMLAAYSVFSVDDEKKHLCPAGQRGYADLVEQKTDAGAFILKIVFVCREREQ